jgi:hypothetical protein
MRGQAVSRAPRNEKRRLSPAQDESPSHRPLLGSNAHKSSPATRGRRAGTCRRRLAKDSYHFLKGAHSGGFRSRRSTNYPAVVLKRKRNVGIQAVCGWHQSARRSPNGSHHWPSGTANAAVVHRLTCGGRAGSRRPEQRGTAGMLRSTWFTPPCARRCVEQATKCQGQRHKLPGTCLQVSIGYRHRAKSCARAWSAIARPSRLHPRDVRRETFRQSYTRPSNWETPLQTSLIFLRVCAVPRRWVSPRRQSHQ